MSEVPRRVTAEELESPIDPSWLAFESTADLPPLEGLVAQPRAVRALEIGLGIRGSGYNVFVVGLSGTNLHRLLRGFVAERLAERAVPCDWVYVNNYDEPDRPIAMSLPAGLGVRLKQDMRDLPQKMAQVLPRALQYQGFNLEKERLQRDYDHRCDAIFVQIREMARQRDLHVELLPQGSFVFAPLRELQPITPEEIAALTPEEQEQFYHRQLELLREAQPLLETQQQAALELQQEVRRIERTFADAILTPLFDPLWKRYPVEKVRHWLERVKEHVLDHLAQFLGVPPAPLTPPEQEDEDFPPLPPMPMPPPLPVGADYDVNVVVDNGPAKAPPVLVEEVPTYKNLFGFIERTADVSNRIITHFTQIKAGSLLRGNGGVVIFNLDDAIDEPLVWKELKRTLKHRRLHIDTYDPIIPTGVSGLKPEPIPLDVKLVVFGSPQLFYFLSVMDPDFGELFRVKAEFAEDMPLDAEGCAHYARLVRQVCERDGLRPFAADAVRELVRYGTRLAADRRLLSADFSRVAGLAREANHWCEQENCERVRADHVRLALEERVYRSNWFAEQALRLMQDGTLLVKTSGRATGIVNSLTVVSLGDYVFGLPVRLTASAWVGQTGVINIERESRMSGTTHDKGMLIMEGYLRGKYARSAPIGLGASLAFEQTYSGVDGDSASAAELFCLVSALSGLPLRQDVGVTGSVNQHGEIQAIGGVNEKVEGFFDVCRIQGLTGTQGVCIPRANLPNLVLRPDVVAAVAEGRFHLWAIGTLDEGLQLLTGLQPGDVDRPQSVHGRVAERFREIAVAMRETPPTPLERPASAPGLAPPPPPPAPPTLPPHG